MTELEDIRFACRWLLTADEAAQFIGVPRWKLNQLTVTGQIPVLRFGRVVRYDLRALTSQRLDPHGGCEGAYFAEFKATQEALFRANATIAELKRQLAGSAPSFPPVPEPQFELTGRGTRLPAAAAVYFLWRGQWPAKRLKVMYVGQAERLCHRVTTSHERVEAGTWVSYLPFPVAELDWREAYYIWKLRPPLNAFRWKSRSRGHRLLDTANPIGRASAP